MKHINICMAVCILLMFFIIIGIGVGDTYKVDNAQIKGWHYSLVVPKNYVLLETDKGNFTISALSAWSDKYKNGHCYNFEIHDSFFMGKAVSTSLEVSCAK
jgi:hypothetical protein